MPYYFKQKQMLKGGSYFIPKVPLMRLIYGQLSMP